MSYCNKSCFAVVWGVLGGGPLFWSVFTVLHVFTFLLLSLRIYYVGQFRLGECRLLSARCESYARVSTHSVSDWQRRRAWRWQRAR